MISLLANFFSDYGVMLILIIGLMFIMFVLPNMSRKKQYQQLQDFLSGLKLGDKVKTTSGFYGTIIAMRETTDGRVALLEMGDGDKKGYIEIDMNAIYTVDHKEDVVYDSDGNIIQPADMATTSEATTDNNQSKDNQAEDDDTAPANNETKATDTTKKE